MLNKVVVRPTPRSVCEDVRGEGMWGIVDDDDDNDV